MTGEKFHTPPEVGRMFGVQPETVILWIRAGVLRAVDIALPGAKKPRFRISHESLDEFLALRATTPPAPKSRRRSREQVPQYV